VNSSPYFGAIVGRYGNRIAGGRLSLGGASYALTRNDGDNCLHGGAVGFDKAVWTIADATDRSVTFTHVSQDGDEGFPGNLRANVTYSLSDSSELRVNYEATTDALTVINLTQHTYWNLGGAGNGSILDHELTIRAASYTPTDAALIPTGEVCPVSGTPFDFRQPTRVGERIHAHHQQILNGQGYDHNFVLDSYGPNDRFAAFLRDPKSGRSLRVETTEPGLQLYTGNRLDGSIIGKRGIQYSAHEAVCLETQHFPDSPNNPQFPSTTLTPGQRYTSQTIFSFGTG
jgi:aldose 1-epimerase